MANMLFPGLGVMKFYFGEGGGVLVVTIYKIRKKNAFSLRDQYSYK